jgi:hypothetical protein
MFDSTIRLKQMNQAELSGFVIPLVQSYLANTGNLTGAFYPLCQNPSGYVISGAFISNTDLDSAITQALAYVAETYYPNTNPAGYTSGSGGGFSGAVSVYQSPKISFKTTGIYPILTVPSDKVFMIDTMEVLSTNVVGASQPPYVSFGISGLPGGLTSSIQSTSNTNYARHIFDNPTDGISPGTSITASITTGSSAATHDGYLIVKGYLLPS